MHDHETPDPPRAQRMPLFVLVTGQSRVFVIEGMPDYDELARWLTEILSLPGESSGPPH